MAFSVLKLESLSSYFISCLFVANVLILFCFLFCFVLFCFDKEAELEKTNLSANWKTFTYMN